MCSQMVVQLCTFVLALSKGFFCLYVLAWYAFFYYALHDSFLPLFLNICLTIPVQYVYIIPYVFNEDKVSIYSRVPCTVYPREWCWNQLSQNIIDPISHFHSWTILDILRISFNKIQYCRCSFFSLSPFINNKMR